MFLKSKQTASTIAEARPDDSLKARQFDALLTLYRAYRRMRDGEERHRNSAYKADTLKDLRAADDALIAADKAVAELLSPTNPAMGG